jgi:PAS domain S-box-containing protein
MPSPEELLRLRLAVEASGEVIFMTDTKGTITYVNPEFVRLYGHAGSDVVGRSTPRILNSGATSPEEYASFWQQLLTHQVVKREFVNRTKSGVRVQIECSANPIVMNDQVVGFLAVQRDVTDRKATEAALRESERRYRTLAEAAQDFIFIVNRNAHIEYANAIGERFGLRGSDAIGRDLHDVFAPQAAEQMWQGVSAVFTTSQRQCFETRFETPDGELWVETSLVPMSRETADTDAVMGVARDITDRKRLEREFTQAQKMEAVGRLAGGIAHDFNNLLTVIQGYSELLLDRVRHDPDLVADLDEVKKAGERASRLTKQLLTFSRKQAFSPRVLDLSAVVAELHRMLGRVIGEDIDIDIVADPQLGRIKADPSQMEQLIVNLAVNARDAMPLGGTLHIATGNADIDSAFAQRHEGAVPGRYVSLIVRDSGCGMTPEVLTHVFEPFFTTKPVGKGTGLGLATVYGIVKQSGGYIVVDSAPDVGTTVTTYLPVVAEAAEAAVAAAVPAKALSGAETILLVEDEAGLRRLMQRTLERLGYTVLQTRDVTHALEIAEHHSGPIDLLLSDVIMPGMNGPDLAQRIVRRRPSIKVLYVSGFTNCSVLDLGSVSPNTCFLAKPFSPQALATRVRECLDPPAGRAGRSSICGTGTF